MFPKNFIDLDQVRLLEFTRRHIPAHCSPHAIGVSPRPVRALLLVPERQRDLVNDEIRAAVIDKRKYRDFLRSGLIVVVGQVRIEAARVNLDQVIEPGLAAVGVESKLIAEEWPVLVLVTRLGTSAESHGAEEHRGGDHRYNESATDDYDIRNVDDSEH